MLMLSNMCDSHVSGTPSAFFMICVILTEQKLHNCTQETTLGHAVNLLPCTELAKLNDQVGSCSHTVLASSEGSSKPAHCCENMLSFVPNLLQLYFRLPGLNWSYFNSPLPSQVF